MARRLIRVYLYNATQFDLNNIEAYVPNGHGDWSEGMVAPGEVTPLTTGVWQTETGFTSLYGTKGFVHFRIRDERLATITGFRINDVIHIEWGFPLSGDPYCTAGIGLNEVLPGELAPPTAVSVPYEAQYMITTYRALNPSDEFSATEWAISLGGGPGYMIPSHLTMNDTNSSVEYKLLLVGLPLGVISSGLMTGALPFSEVLPAKWMVIGTANHVISMTAGPEGLLAVTSDNKLWRRDATVSSADWFHIGDA